MKEDVMATIALEWDSRIKGFTYLHIQADVAVALSQESEREEQTLQHEKKKEMKTVSIIVDF